jgi:hypothetical protein
VVYEAMLAGTLSPRARLRDHRHGLKKISLAADGVAPKEGSPVFQLRENVTLTITPEVLVGEPDPDLGPGTVDVSKGEIRIKAYAV